MAQNDKDPPNIFRRLNPPIFDELKPLPVFSGIITCDQKADEHQPRRFSKPYINFKIEVVNNVANKRKLRGSSPDATPFKKPFGPQALSPDVGCFVDGSPLGRQDSVSMFTPALMHKRRDVGSEVKEMVGSQLNPKHGASMEPGGKNETKAGDLMCETVLLNSTFDYDVDDLLCLNPISPARFLVDEESCRSGSSQIFQDEPLPIVGLSVEVGTTPVQVEGRGDEVKKEMCLSVKDGDDDRGYFSLSCTNDHKGCGWVNSEQLTANLNLCVGTPEGDGHPERPSKPKGHEPAVICGHFITLDSLSDSEPPLEPVDSEVNCLESCDAEEVWDIGPPIFESSVCNGETDKLKAEPSGQVLEEVQESLSEPVHSTRGDSTVETSYETSLPLQLQVKSKVVFPVQHPYRSPPVSGPVANREPTDSVRALQPAKRPTQRPVVFSSEAEWEQEKRLYVHSVVGHMHESPAVDNGVTSELQNLMSHVADESAGAKGREWQHPSDLTRRNYRRRFGTAAAGITLDAWRAKNGPKHKRFDKIPKIFERSHFP